ncbi:MAG TPA: hypothetical protein VJH23_04410 [archaeon]|nr:hypothetical protein [archaeon]
MSKAILFGLIIASLLVAGCASQQGYEAAQPAQNAGADQSAAQSEQITGMESDLTEMESSLGDADFSQYEFLEVDDSTFK